MSDENYNQLISLIAQIKELRKESITHSSSFKAWRATVQRHLKKTWPDDDSYLTQFNDITYESGLVMASTGDSLSDITARKQISLARFYKGLDVDLNKLA